MSMAFAGGNGRLYQRGFFVRRSIVRLLQLAAVVAVGAGTVRAQAAAGTVPAQIVTTGTGEIRVAPDRATVFVGVQSRAPTAASAAADNSRRQRAILDTLHALGLGSDQLSTINYNVSPEMQYNPNNQPPKVIGYSVTNTVRADVRKLDDVARVIDAVLSNGANEISGLQFYSSKADSARRAAMAIAVANARADAEVLAKAAGGTLGALLELSTSGFVRPMQDVAGGIAMARAATPIEPGQQSVTAMVTARWTFVAR
jgi:uncharacterized protein YggE